VASSALTQIGLATAARRSEVLHDKPCEEERRGGVEPRREQKGSFLIGWKLRC
jgi:hypothetical protein